MDTIQNAVLIHCPLQQGLKQVDTVITDTTKIAFLFIVHYNKD